MWNEITAWQEALTHRPDLSTKTIALYTQDARRFATWLQSEHPGLKATEVTPIDAKTYRDHLLAKRFAPTTINRALISLMLFFDTVDGTNPFRNLTMIDVVEPAPVALSKTEWNAVRRCAEQLVRRDHGLAQSTWSHPGPAASSRFCVSRPDTTHVSVETPFVPAVPTPTQRDALICVIPAAPDSAIPALQSTRPHTCGLLKWLKAVDTSCFHCANRSGQGMFVLLLTDPDPFTSPVFLRLLSFVPSPP
jgi:Phage integrase, N-terminal SAM-like domain